MGDALKQRLVGAAVLVALAVIFIPIILDGPDSQPELRMDLEIPPRPTVTPELLGPSAFPITTTEPLVELNPGPQRAETAEPSSANTQPDVLTEPADTTVEEIVAEADLRVTTAAPQADETLPTEVSKPVTQMLGWVVQVGSFREQRNALVLRDRLLAAKFSVFVEDSPDVPGSFRVRVGPVNDRAGAQLLAEEIKSKTEIGGLVMRHSVELPSSQTTQ